MGEGNRSKGKLEQAIENAALQNINEDLYEILENIEQLKRNIPADIKSRATEINDELYALRRAIVAIPEEFDSEFTRKINRVLGVVAEVEENTEKINRVFRNDIPSKVVSLLDKKLKDKHLITNFQLFIFGLVCSVSAALFSSFCLMLAFKYLL